MEVYKYCQVCSIDDDYNPNDDPNHLTSVKHCFNFLLWEYANYRKALVRNRHGVELTVTVQQKNGYIYNFTNDDRKGKYTFKITPEALASHDQIEFKCTIKNNRKSMNILIHPTEVILIKYDYFQWHDPQNNLDNEKFIELTPGSEYSVIIKYHDANSNILSIKLPVSLTFQTVEEKPQRFSILRSINISVGASDETSNDETGPSPFKGKPWPSGIQVMPPIPYRAYPYTHGIPASYWKVLLYGIDNCYGRFGNGNEYYIAQELEKALKPGYVTSENFKQFWHIVLWQEEMAQTISLQKYNMENVTLQLTELPSRRLFVLQVRGLAEKRPSLIKGDYIDIRIVGDEHRGYRGEIVKVQDEDVLIGSVDEEFTNYWKINPSIEVCVRFVLGRLSYERMHQGVDQVVANGMVSLLFPEENLKKRSVYERRPLNEFFNGAILTNPEQKTAVSKILNNTSKPVPYIVFGPPGTGKTVTLVEAILQIKQKTQKKILVCAPANAACDVLAEKLMKYCKKNEMIRLMSQTVDMNNIPPMLLDYSNYNKETKTFEKVLSDELQDYRIVVTTLIYIGQYSRKLHPDVIFIDEAAQAPEPEVCSAIGIGDRDTQIVLAGDPKQLGPSVFSKEAKLYHLDFSLLERLMERELYASGDTNYITMLKKNFRSHETILTLPNEMFYGNQLEALSADAKDDPLAQVNICQTIPNIQKKKKNKQPTGSAVEYFSLISKEKRQGKSPSYFNPKESEMVFRCVQALLKLSFQDSDQNVKQEQIGIITPYVRQVYNIRQYLKNNNILHVEVGTTETFQGREKRIIIISTVRAQKDLLLHDKKYRLGFVKQKKRFNVAMTRAKAKLIVIGCSHVLCTDKKWQRYIEFCEQLGSFYGAPYDKIKRTDENIADITRRLGNIQFKDSQNAHQ